MTVQEACYSQANMFGPKSGRPSGLGIQRDAFALDRRLSLKTCHRGQEIDRRQLSARVALIAAPRHSDIQSEDSPLPVEHILDLPNDPVSCSSLPKESRLVTRRSCS